VAVAVEVAKGRGARAPPNPAGEAHRRGHLAERAVQVIAVRAGSGSRREQEIEITVVVKVHEQRLGGSRGVREARRGRDVSKLATAPAPEHGSPPAGRDV
jgi:hypothetical protein